MPRDRREYYASQEYKERRKQYWASPEYKERRKQRIANMTPEQLAEYRAKNRNKRRRLRASRTPEQKAKDAAYDKEYQQEHKAERAEKRKGYEQMKREQRLANSEMIKPSQAAAILGVDKKLFERWMDDGRIPFIQLEPHGIRLIKRSDIQALMDSAAPSVAKWVQESGRTPVKKEISFVRKAQGFVVPTGFDLITTYKELTEYTLAFAMRQIGFLLLVGSPGSGKSRQIKGDLQKSGVAHTWIDSHVTNLGLYCAVYEADSQPVILDDVNHFLNNRVACSLCKAFTQTEKVKKVNWESSTRTLDEREIPRCYETSSPFCMIGNGWDYSNADYAAIQDRALPVAFFPSAEAIHERVIELGWCDPEVVEFIGQNLSEIPQPSMREYYQGMCLKRAGFDWTAKLLALWES